MFCSSPNKYNLNLFLAVLVILLSASCKKFVQTDPPQTQLVTESVFASNATAHSALTVIYSKMINENSISYFIPLFTGLSSDELTSYSSQPSLVQFYKNSLNPLNGLIYPNLWTPFYSYVYQANAVIEGLKSSITVNNSVKQQLTGEAKFIRAFSYFYLVNFFGDVPIITTTDYTHNSVVSRNTKAEVYQQIIADLSEAKNFLNINYVDATDTSVTTERVRPNKSTASALLARVYLYTDQWTQAENEANLIISNGLYDTVKLNTVFLKNNKEAIWQLQPVATNKNTPEGINFILSGPPASNVNNCTTISSHLLASFEAGDNRLQNWVGSYSSFRFPYKYKEGASSSTVKEYSVVFRLGEQYLIRAEARAQLGNTGGAISDLNVIRKRAGLQNYSGNTSKDSVLAAILHEGQVELFTEWGHRWFDLKRTNNIDPIMSIVTPLKGGIWNTNWQLYPIPQGERNNDPNLSQNNGY